MAERFQIRIGAEWLDSSDGRTFEQRNPARLTEVTSLFPLATADDARRAVDAARAAWPAWRDTPLPRRAEILGRALELMRARRDAIASVLTAENGKTLAESRTEIDSAVREMEFQIGEGIRLVGETNPVSLPGVFAYSTRVPLGVVAVISPWNFPFNVPARKCVPALIAGNTCVFKPASLTPQTGLRFAELFYDAGLPDGVLNFITGSGRAVGDTLVGHPQVRAVSFTGSTEVGKAIQASAAANLTRTQLELGGKNPAVVLEDADLDLAASAVVRAAFACAGQWCTSTSRAVVVRGVAAEFTRRVVAGARALRVGAGTDPQVEMGPVCGESQRDNILRYIAIGREEGAELLTGGSRLATPPLDEGCFLEPTVFGGVRPGMRIAQEEIFGPVLSILEVSDFEEALEVANGVAFGLASSIYTRDLCRAMTFLERTDVGLTHVNLMTALKEPNLPFGGVKDSGFGIPEAGHFGVEFFTEHKAAYVKYR